MGALASDPYVMERGKHRGARMDTMPTSHLMWMVRVRARGFSCAAVELEKRSENASVPGQHVAATRRRIARPLAKEESHA